MNTWESDWPRFFRARRLSPQLHRVADHGAPGLAKTAQPLLAGLFKLFAGYTPQAALLHGDLWSGNRGFAGGRPALFDPAVYSGDSESDLAMTELFGSFGPRFYAAYHGARRQDAGYSIRRTLYQLYPILNHYNILGGGYRHLAARLIDELAEHMG